MSTVIDLDAGQEEVGAPATTPGARELEEYRDIHEESAAYWKSIGATDQALLDSACAGILTQAIRAEQPTQFLLARIKHLSQLRSSLQEALEEAVTADLRATKKEK